MKIFETIFTRETEFSRESVEDENFPLRRKHLYRNRHLTAKNTRRDFVETFKVWRGKRKKVLAYAFEDCF